MKLQPDNTVINQDLNNFSWKLEEYNSKEAIERVARILTAYIKLKELSLMNFRPKLNEMIKTFHKQFSIDMEEETPKDDSALHSARIGFIVLYFNAFKRFLNNFAELTRQILQKSVAVIDMKPASEKSAQNMASSTKTVTHTAQELCSVFGIMIQCFQDKIAQIIQSADINKIPCSQFSRLVSVVEEVISFLKEANFQEQICPNTDTETVKKALLKTVSSYLGNISVNPLISLKMLIEKQYIQTLFINTKAKLLSKLSQEKWQSASIPIES